MEATTQSLVLYTVLQLCAMVGVISRALPNKEEQTLNYQAKGNLVLILGVSLVGYLIFLFG
jgi:hypothetical protein